ncbi:MAG: hypothetical protein K2G60_06410 [Oscillospiraceae bacterium]|nr:hypothetical protein [Oscillospiraceae bacterium]
MAIIMEDRIPDSLIDDILDSTKLYSSDTEPSAFSVEDVDDLLLSLGITEFSETEEQPASVLEDTEIAAVPERQEEIPLQVEKTTLPVQELEDAKEVQEEELKISFNQYKKKHKKKASGFLDSIKKSNSMSDTAENFSEETKNVSVSEDKHGQMELQVGGEEISTIEEEYGQENVKTEVPSVSGQISIEKTRMFNEVKIHGEYNPNISHNLGNKVVRTTKGEGEAVSTPVMGEEKYRKHFMNKPVQNLEKTQEHRELISSLPVKTLETPGIIVKKNKYASINTDGFEPIPTIVPAVSELQGERNAHSDDISDGQIMLDGFGEEEVIEKTTEEEAEAKLRETRKEVVKEFVDNVSFKQDVEDIDSDEDIARQAEQRKKRYERRRNRIKREFFGPKDTDAVIEEFLHEKRKITARLVVLSVICAIMAVISLAAASGRGSFDLFGGEGSAYIGAELFLLAICCIINYKSFRETLRNFEPGLDLAVVLSAFVGALQAASAFGFADYVESTVHLFTAAAVVPMIFKAVAELIVCRNDLENFLVLLNGENSYYAVENIEDEDSAAEIARGLMLGEPEIKYSSKIGFPSRFVELSREADITPSIIKLSLLGVTAASLIIGIITLILQKDILIGISSLTGALLMGIPAAAGIISAASLAHANKKLRDDGTVINGYSAVENAVYSNGIIIDSADAFKSGGCNIEGIKLYHKMRIDEAILYTASVVIASGGVLSEIFEGVIEGKKELLLPVETLAYEEKLGCSCWIHNHRVLVGNKELLKHHNVELPEDGLEDKFRELGKNTLYLAIEGKIAAMFIVVYKADETTAHYVRALERDGVSILFRTSDANITESFLEHEFGLPKNVVKIINPVAGEMFTKIKNEEKEQSDALIVHDGRAVTMLKALHSAFGVTQFVNASRTVQAVAAVIGILLVASLSFMSAISQISVWQIILYQLVWGTVLYCLPAIKKPDRKLK